MSDNDPPAPPAAPAAPGPVDIPAATPAAVPTPEIPVVGAEPTLPSGPSPAAPTPAPSVAGFSPPASAAPSVHSMAPSSRPSPIAPILAAPVAATAHNYGPAPVVHHLTTAPTPYRPSTLPQQLKRLAYVVSIVLGGSAVVAGIWSAFLLPLLHATFSARTALVAPQRDRWRSILERLQEIRLTSIFPEPKLIEEIEGEEPVGPGALVRTRTHESEKSKSKEKEEEKKDKEKELALEKKGGPDSPRSATIAVADEDKEPAEPGPNRLFGDVSPLSLALRDLASSLDATATTRTSLVSTLEGYTSGLHRELFNARGGTPWGSVPGSNSSTSRVGLGTLGANLAKAGGGESSPLGLPAAKSEEWDNARREVRAIKGLLLNRRNFSLPSRTAA